MNKYKRNGKEVIVVGAGVSGLTVAKGLKELGFSVIVLESTGRIGGRLKTNRSLGFNFDEGASWIHTPIGNPITNVAKKSGINLFLTDDNSIIAYDKDGKIISDDIFEKEEQVYYSIIEELQEYGDIGRSFEKVYRQEYPELVGNLLQRFFLSVYLTFDTGGLNVLSSLYYDEGEEFEGSEKIVTNGYDTLAQYLSTELNIKLNERVRKIKYRKKYVEILTDKKQYLADYVVVTTPLGVLKSGNIIFSPKLPYAKRKAIRDVGMNNVEKYFFLWEDIFWDDTQYIAYAGYKKDIFNYFLNVNKIDKNTNGLMTFAFAKEARRLSNLSDNEVIDEVMRNLRVIYGNNIPRPIKMLRSNWGNDINTFGAYSFTAINTEMEYFDKLGERVGQRLLFAGEHTSKDYYSTVHGAYLSGKRIIDEFKKIRI